VCGPACGKFTAGQRTRRRRRESPGCRRLGAGLRNSGDSTDRLVKVESDIANAVELHKTTMEGSMMKMAPVENVEVPAKGQAELKPGGLHVMLIGLKRELKADEKIKLKLQFEKGGTQEVEAVVRKP
jgi:copper(I)-binding protein